MRGIIKYFKMCIQQLYIFTLATEDRSEYNLLAPHSFYLYLPLWLAVNKANQQKHNNSD